MNKEVSNTKPERAATEPLYDAPITEPNQDQLGRANFAKSLAKSILTMKAPEGYVLGLHGPWGSGKTSILNLVLYYLKDQRQIEEAFLPHDKIIIVEFNPWWFSGKDQLIQQYFLQFRAGVGVSKGVKESLAGLGDQLDRFARVLEPLRYVPVFTPWMWIRDLVSGVVKFFKGAGIVDPHKIKADICKKLQNSPYRILVVIDDIDRLEKIEVRQVFQLVKAVADFPNTIYLLAFDRDAVVKMLNADAGGTAPDYLEKVIQAPFTVPAPDRASLRKLFFEQIEETIQETPEDLWDSTEWGNLYWDALDRLIKTPRFVKQFVNTLRPLYAGVIGEVRAVDFLGIHAIRVVCPKALEFMANNKTLMVGDPASLIDDSGRAEEERRKAFDSLLELVQEEHRFTVQSILRRLFPRVDEAYGGTHYADNWQTEWRKQRRVCSRDVFDYYFQLAVPPGAMSNAEFARILGVAIDPHRFAGALKQLRNERQPDGTPRLSVFLDRLLEYVSDQPVDAFAEPVICTILNVGDQLYDPLENTGFYDLGGDERQLRFLLHHLLRRVDDQGRRYDILKGACEAGAAVSLMVGFVRDLEESHKKATGDILLPVEQTEELRSLMVKKIKDSAKSGTLTTTPLLPGVLSLWARWEGEDGPKDYAQELIRNDPGFVRLVLSFLRRVISGGIGDRVARTIWRVHVDSLVNLTDSDPEELQRRAEGILDMSPDWIDERMRLALQTLISEVKDPRDRYGRPRPEGEAR